MLIIFEVLESLKVYLLVKREHLKLRRKLKEKILKKKVDFIFFLPILGL